MVVSKRRAKNKKSLENSANSDFSLSLVSGGAGAVSTTIVGRLKGNVCACAAVANGREATTMATRATMNR